MAKKRRQNPWHLREAREAFEDALDEADFRAELESFAREHPAPALHLREATRESPAYAEELRGFCERLGLTAPWFLDRCHDLNWASRHESPRLVHLHPLPDMFGTLKLTLHPLKSGAPSGGDDPFRLREFYCAAAFWIDDTKPRVRKELLAWCGDALTELGAPATVRLRFEVIDGRRHRTVGVPRRGEARRLIGAPGESLGQTCRTLEAALDELWDHTVEPARRERGGVIRRRELKLAQRDARAFTARAQFRLKERPPGHAMTRRVAECLEARFGYENLQEEQIKKALTKFGALVETEL